MKQTGKDALIDKAKKFDCTLDGKPAVITGRLNRFATVSQLNTGLSVEYSWQAVGRILSRRISDFKGI